MIGFIKPQKPRKFKSEEEMNKILSSDQWISERKYRGIRLLASRDLCWSALGNEKDIDWLIGKLPQGCLLDGELLTRNPACKEGDVTTAVAFHQEELIFIVFDILYLKDCPVMHLPWKNRRRLLEDVVRMIMCDRISTSEICENNHLDFYNRILSEGGEGLVFKKVDAEYDPGSRKNMIKYKPYFEVDVVVVDAEGYPTKGSSQWHKGYRNLRYGLYDEITGELKVLGSLGKTKPKEYLEQHYVGKVAAVTCLGQFDTGCLNHIVSIHYRDDKDPKSCTFRF